MRHKYFVIGLVFIVGAAQGTTGAEVLSLAGGWEFELDPGDRGIGEKFYARQLKDSLQLPGSLQEQGFGEDVDVNTKWVVRFWGSFEHYPSWFTSPIYAKYRQQEHFAFPYCLQPKKHYVGVGWYQKEVNIPQGWRDKRIMLVLERCHWGTQVWIDGKKTGAQDSLVVPHRYDCAGLLMPGRNTITIRVDNRMLHDVGYDAHSVTDHTQTAWNGIIGGIFLKASDKLYIEDMQIYPDVDKKKARVLIKVGGISQQIKGELTLKAEAYNTNKPHSVPEVKCDVLIEPAKKTIELAYNLTEKAQLWDEFEPVLYRLEAELAVGDGKERITVKRTESFGLRNIAVRGTQFIINGRKTFLRGTLECCIFPLTGYPPTDIESWERIMRAVKEWGLNHIRFHSWCPPEAAFRAADKVGVYLLPECPVWNWTKSEESDMTRFLEAEWHRILREYGNHPSFAFFGCGNEGLLPKDFLWQLLDEAKRTDARRVYTGFANGFVTDNTDYDVKITTGNKKDPADRKAHRVRYQGGWPPNWENTYFNTRAPSTTLDYTKDIRAFGKPIISHEIVQRCSYPDVEDIHKYRGSLSPGYLVIAKDQLREKGLLDQKKMFVQASGRWQVQLFKEEIEAALRTKGMAGFQLLDLHDFPGQGTALVGVLDAFWDCKGYVKAGEFRNFCGKTVPLARMKKRVWHRGELFSAKVEIAHFGAGPMEKAKIDWRITDKSAKIIAAGQWIVPEIAVDNGIEIGEIKQAMSGFEAPAKYTLQIALKSINVQNEWDFWVYPEKLVMPTNKYLLITEKLSADALQALREGRDVLLLPSKEYIKGDVKPGFTTIYWDRVLTDGGEVDTLGMLCNPRHAALKEFPTEFHSNWQWWEPMVHSKGMILDGLPKSFKPMVQMIDDWNLNRKLGLIFEAKVEKGKILVCSIDLTDDIGAGLVSRQLKYSLLNYLASEKFVPRVHLTINQLKKIFNE